jgi:hypothetical protein
MENSIVRSQLVFEPWQMPHARGIASLGPKRREFRESRNVLICIGMVVASAFFKSPVPARHCRTCGNVLVLWHTIKGLV